MADQFIASEEQSNQEANIVIGKRSFTKSRLLGLKGDSVYNEYNKFKEIIVGLRRKYST